LRKYSRASKSRSKGKTRFLRRVFPFSFRITREGLLYLAGVLILSLAAINTGNNLLFMVLAALLSTIAVSGIVSRNSLRHILLSMQVPENVFAGEGVSIKLSMTNLKRIFPSFSLRVEDPELSRQHSPFHIPGLEKRKNGDSTEDDLNRTMLRQAAYFPILRPGETRSELTVQSFPHRGRYTLEGFWLSTRFPFGFFRRGERVDAKGEVLVYPLVQEISSFFHLLPFLPGRLDGSNLVGPGENLFSIRKYQEGESARIINWKATAKTGELMALEYARDEESKFGLILDTRIGGGEPAECHERFEKAVALAASLSAHFIKEGAALEFLTPHEYLPRGTGIDHLYRILRSLAVIQFETTQAAPESSWDFDSFPVTGERQNIGQILSDKVFKIIITEKPRGSFPSAIWRSSHVVFFGEL
jgi:uncharacterized protein (DUF58 family)